MTREEEQKLVHKDSKKEYIENIKPYLLPLSSMTDEQEEEYNDLNCYELGCFPHTEEALDYLIKNYFNMCWILSGCQKKKYTKCFKI